MHKHDFISKKILAEFTLTLNVLFKFYIGQNKTASACVSFVQTPFYFIFLSMPIQKAHQIRPGRSSPFPAGAHSTYGAHPHGPG